MQFRILGPLEVTCDGEPVELRGAKQRALLALLLLRANEVVSRDALIEGLWGGGQPRGAEHSLEAHVSRLRKRLHGNGQDVVLTRPGGYVLIVGDGELDRDRFERLTDEARAALRSGDESSAADLLREALSLWRGKPLEDVPLDSFAVTEIGGIEDRHLGAYEDLFEAELARGNEAEILPELERLVRLNPLRERPRAQLMLALYRCGRQAEALDEYRRARRQLADDLGIEPGPELRELEQAILRQDDRLTRAASSPDADRARARRPPRRWLVAGALSTAAAIAGVMAALLTLGSSSRALSHVDANAVGLINPQTGKITEQVPLGAAPGDLAIGERAVWEANPDAQTVSRIDPVRWIRDQTFPLGSGPSGIATGDGAVWVANSLDGTVSRIDPDTNLVVDTISAGNGPVGLAFGAGSLWVANVADGTVARINAASDKVERTIDVAADELAFGDGALWASDTGGNSVWRIDPETNTALQPIPVGKGPAGIAYGDGSVWVADNLDGTVSRIDPATNSVGATIQVGGSPRGIAVGGGGIWVTDESADILARIDPRTDRVVQRVRVGNRPEGVAFDDASGRVLIGVRAPGAGHRGGTLSLNINVIDSIDTAVAYDVNAWSVLNVTGDGLVALGRTDGIGGTQLVPDLAVSIPRPTNFGKTYTFRVRPNIRYSSGRLVKASDLRYALERGFRLGSVSPASGFYRGIVGGRVCAKAPRRCDLSKGIVVDDAANTITFKLRAPDPEFLFKLALPFAYAVPAGTPARDVGTHPLPATGPYVIAAYSPNHLLTLVRNPYFHEWSEAAQPDGYPDEIDLTIGATADHTLVAVERAQADGFSSWGPGEPSPDRLRELRARFSSRLHVNPRPVTVGFFLNTHLPPFDDVKVRRAVNYAADRGLAVHSIGGPDAGEPTCQILPPNFQGYEPYCPYTAGSGTSGHWVAPDLARAKKLIAASATRGMKVRVWFDPWARPWFRDLGPYVVRLLDSLGYRASVMFDRPSTNIEREQVGFVAWASDYPSAWDFLTPLSCSSWSQFCDPSIDRQAAKALQGEATNPRDANLAWARIDRRLVDEAAWLPLLTPKWIDFLSKRVGNYQYNPERGMLIDQVWVR